MSLNVSAKDKIKYDPNCQRSADISEGLVKLKEIGYTIDQLNAFVSEPVVQQFPIQSLKQYVYSLDKSSMNSKEHVLNFCQNLGFDEFNKYLLQNDEIINLRNNIETLTSKLKFIQEENAALKERLAPVIKKK